MKKRIYLLMISIFVFISSISIIYAVNINNLNKNESKSLETEKKLVLADYERKKYDISSPSEKEISVLDPNYEIVINDESRKLLEYLGKSIDGDRQVKRIYKKDFNREYIRVITDNVEIDFDDEGNIVSYENKLLYSGPNHQHGNYVITDESQLADIISNLESIAGLDSYKLTSCSNLAGASWILTWQKEYENGLLNNYENVNVVVDACEGSIWLYGNIKDFKPNITEPVISEEEAIKCAKDIMEKYKSEKASATLGFTRPNFFFEEGSTYEMADFVRLCYNVNIGQGIIVNVDAETGEILGGSISRYF